MFYSMHVLTIIITCTFLVELEVQERKNGSYMRIGVMEDAHGYYSHEEEIKGLHFSMGNDKIESNGIRDKQEPVTMRSMHREVENHRADNERMMKEQEKQTEINAVLLQSLSDLQRQMKHEPEIQNHGCVSGHTKRSTSRKVHPRGKGPMQEDSTEKEAGDSEGSSSSRTGSYSRRK